MKFSVTSTLLYLAAAAVPVFAAPTQEPPTTDILAARSPVGEVDQLLRREPKIFGGIKKAVKNVGSSST